MNEGGKSDGRVVPAKPANKAARAAAESVEGRRPAEGSTASKTRPGRRAGHGAPSALDRVREWAISPKAAAGVDGVTWAAWGQDLEANLHDLHRRLHAGRYRARPSRRAYIPKSDGRLRPLGIAALEDKVVQRAVVEVLNAVYEAEFRGFSYGFRPGRNPHQALDALTVGIERRRVSWVLDADIRDFFGQLDRDWLRRFLEHRIADRRVLRLIDKWLAAGVVEDGTWSQTVEGTPQGASVSPLLANVYLHYVFDLWADWWRRRYAHGDMVIVRWADDFIVGFQHRADAERFLAELRERFAKFGLGAKTRAGRFWVRRITISKRMRAKLREVKDQLKARRHQPVPEQGRWLGSVVRGHRAYYAVPGNRTAVATFRTQVTRYWHEALERRSQRTRIGWVRMNRLATRWLPPARVVHPFPDARLHV